MKHGTKLILWNLLAMAGVAMFLLICAWFWMASFTPPGEEIVVPDVTNMLYGDASYKLDELGLVAVVQDSAYDKTLPAGCVLEQIPTPGKVVKQSRLIYLTINQGYAPTRPLPDIADNCSWREAEAKLRAQGFKLGPTEFAPGEQDWVLAVKCRGVEVHKGDKIPLDMPVVLVVGNSDSYDEVDDEWGNDSTDTSPIMEVDEW